MNREEVLNLIEKSATKIAARFHPYFLQHGWTWNIDGKSRVPTLQNIVDSVFQYVKSLREHKEYKFINSGRICIKVYKLPGEDDDYWDCNIRLYVDTLGICELEEKETSKAVDDIIDAAATQLKIQESLEKAFDAPVKFIAPNQFAVAAEKEAKYVNVTYEISDAEELCDSWVDTTPEPTYCNREKHPNCNTCAMMRTE